MRIGLDLDGVIIDHHPHKLVLARDYGYALEPWQANSNVMGEYVNEPHYGSLRDKLYTHMTLAASPTIGALEHLARLPGELFIVSARRPPSSKYAEMWLENAGVHEFIPRANVHFVGHPMEKRAHLERLGIDVFLDDELRVLHSLPDSVRRFLFDPDGISGKLEIKPEISSIDGWVAFLEALR